MTTTHAEQILVLGGTGKTGRRVVRRLREAGVAVRAASRSGEVRFDWFEPDSWAAALEGASAVYLVAPEDPAPVHDFVKRAVDAGVRRFVALSGRGIEHVTGDFGQGMVAAEQAVRGSGVEWTVIQPNNFDQNFDEDLWLEPLRAGRLALPIGDVPEPFVDVEDVAEVAAVLLTEDGHAGRVYELSGPRGLTFAEAAETIGRAAGRTIEYVELTPEEYHRELLGQGYPEAAVRMLGALFEVHRGGHLAGVADGVRQVLGREPASFEDYAARTAAAGAWS
ncbi:NAD(P)H-binding protein [Planomonospora sp. ID91781]|uniref:NmrA family NAD(P)-binding protein n=1 Tax=Planomonospora sp. ID91781 TaxID=2738135 RepID=UPI0018C3D57A|nr:NAD(P)H-binding protein [Planomonospora sp. ID91781]MBG0819416.1 NAD(P)H-binding protein [Planomonospora sp. ID91781]